MSWLTSLFGAPSQAELDAQDAALRAQNELDRSKYGEDWYNGAQGNIDRGYVDAAAQIEAGWNQGIREGQGNVSGVFKTVGGVIQSTADSITGGLTRLIPWQLWLALLAVGVFYAWPFLSRVLAKKKIL